MSFGVAEGEQPRLLHSLGIRPPPSCTRPALLHLPQGRSSGQGLAVPPILPASLPPIPSVQEAPSQVPRRDVRADATQESSGGDAGAAGGERAGPFALRRPGCRVWGGRSASPAGVL
ncbi:Dynamin-3 [Manis pentadactyla]|nr:Dynamin-3 [Manis pentadactyla]